MKEEGLKKWEGIVVVLDDDPTGIQTVHDVSVYTGWDLDSVRDGFKQKEGLFFILTNSRSFSVEKTIAVHREITRNILTVSKELSKDFMVVLRGDSTLRGHTVLEPETVAEVLEREGGQPVDGEIYCPCFFECGRVTEGDIHYIETEGKRTPVACTEFSKDRTFGYSHSGLREYLEEKVGGNFSGEDCLSVETKLLEGAESEQVKYLLSQVSGQRKIIVNATNYGHLDVFCNCLKNALLQGKKYVVRSSASFVKSMGDIKDKPLLNGGDLKSGNCSGGLILIGSHVEKTTRQLNYLMSNMQITCLEFCMEQVFVKDGLFKEAERIRKEVQQKIGMGETVIVFTSRNLIAPLGITPEEQLNISVRISKELTGLVERLEIRPSYLIAKGGITSSDIGVKGLRVKKARVAGQLSPGIPVWLTGQESKFPGMPYVIFPGNVGTDTTLLEIVRMF